MKLCVLCHINDFLVTTLPHRNTLFIKQLPFYIFYVNNCMFALLSDGVADQLQLSLYIVKCQ